jgi:protein-tyrosine-phosphatase
MKSFSRRPVGNALSADPLADYRQPPRSGLPLLRGEHGQPFPTPPNAPRFLFTRPSNSVSARSTAVLFACTQNAVRSPMAEGILKHLLGHRIYVDSVGVRRGNLDPFAVQVMDEIGIDIAGHRPKSFDELEDDSFDEVISLSPEAQHRAVDMTRVMACNVVFWNTFDPTLVEGSRDARLDAYRQVRDQLIRRIKEHFGIAPMADL